MARNFLLDPSSYFLTLTLIIGPMAEDIDARRLLESLKGKDIATVTGRRNVVLDLDLDGDKVLVATDRSPGGEPVPVEWVDNGIERLFDEGEVEVSVPSLGHRSSFIGAVLLQVPGTVLISGRPPRVRLLDAATQYRIGEAGQVNAWWSADPRQRFWLEVTDRPDIGIDLHCPQRDAAGNRNPGYSLIWWVEIGDIVCHYSLNERAIVAWSRAAGRVTVAPTVWLSHRGATRRRLQTARAQPGWWLDLEGPFPLDEPVTLAQLREHSDDVRAVAEQLRADHAGSLYFPFYFWGGTELRPMQPYLNKLPAELVDIFPHLTPAAAAAQLAPTRPSPPRATDEVGAAYRVATVSSVPAAREPFSVDPGLVERALRGHADTQNELAEVLRGAGIEPRSPGPNEPNFDLAWKTIGTLFVAEVKSITDENEEGQLRLGLGQVLRYRHRLERLGHERVLGVLVPEREPHDPTWRELCDGVGVIMLSRGELDRAPELGRDFDEQKPPASTLDGSEAATRRDQGSSDQDRT